MLYLRLPAFMFGATNVGYLLVHMLHCPAGLESRRRHVALRMNTFSASQHSLNAHYRDEEHQFRQTMEKMTEKVVKKGPRTWADWSSTETKHPWHINQLKRRPTSEPTKRETPRTCPPSYTYTHRRPRVYFPLFMFCFYAVFNRFVGFLFESSAILRIYINILISSFFTNFSFFSLFLSPMFFLRNFFIFVLLPFMEGLFFFWYVLLPSRFIALIENRTDLFAQRQ